MLLPGLLVAVFILVFDLLVREAVLGECYRGNGIGRFEAQNVRRGSPRKAREDNADADDEQKIQSAAHKPLFAVLILAGGLLRSLILGTYLYLLCLIVIIFLIKNCVEIYILISHRYLLCRL